MSFLFTMTIISQKGKFHEEVLLRTILHILINYLISSFFLDEIVSLAIILRDFNCR